MNKPATKNTEIIQAAFGTSFSSYACKVSRTVTKQGRKATVEWMLESVFTPGGTPCYTTDEAAKAGVDVFAFEELAIKAATKKWALYNE